MVFRRIISLLAFCTAAMLGFAAAGCGFFSSSDHDQRERDEKTRDAVAKATEQVKPILQEAGKDLKDVAKVAAEQAHAAVAGAKEGWERGGQKALDLNSATETELIALPGITRRQARRIIAARPYRDKHELVSRGILKEDDYSKISDAVTAK
jgi:DNA uptake protein ComE-like DNA-binding protein